MKKSNPEIDVRVRQKIMNWKEFSVSYVVMLILVGIQVGIIVMPAFNTWHVFFQINIILLYWAIIAFIFSLITNRQIKQYYDIPMRRLGNAAQKVAKGDFSVYVEPLHTPDKYDYIDVMFIDFNTMVQELGSIETLKNDFVANVSHEIKTPLAVIKNYTTLLKTKKLPDNLQKEYMETIIRATDNLSALVSNILRLNKLENQEIASPSEPFDLCRQLSECVLDFESLVDEKDIELDISIEDRAIITADKELLEIVWKNLLSNAFKYTETSGKVSLIQTSESDSITVVVADTGCGMDKETMKHIFDKFYQADTSHSGEGNGLGLALASRIIERIGGSLSVSSELGKGSAFTVAIPVQH